MFYYQPEVAKFITLAQQVNMYNPHKIYDVFNKSQC